jgi:hypothetical protein
VELCLLGKVSWRVFKLSIEVAYGEWEMGLILISGMTHGYRIAPVVWLLLLEET